MTHSSEKNNGLASPIVADDRCEQTSPFWLAVAVTGSGVAFDGVVTCAVAGLIAPVPEETHFATILTERAGETSRTGARACVCA